MSPARSLFALFSFKRLILLGVMVALCVMAFALQTRAANGINRQINYQAKLMDSTGTAVVNGTYAIKFSLYNTATSGTALWTASGTTASPIGLNVSVSNGLFTVLLGDTTSSAGSQNAFGDQIDWNSDSLYLGVTVGADNEMSPRKRIAASPYAFNAERLQGMSASGTAFGTESLFTINQTSNTSATGTRAALEVRSAGTSNANDFLIRGVNDLNDTVFSLNREGNVSSTGALIVNGGATSTFASAVSSTRGIFDQYVTVNGKLVCLVDGTNCQTVSSSGDANWIYDPSNGFVRLVTSTNSVVLGNTATSTGAPVYFELSGGLTGTSTVYYGFATNTNVVIGGTSTTDVGLNSAFIMDGNDLFVSGNIGSVSSVFTNGEFIAGAGSTRYGNGYINKNDGNLLFDVSGGYMVPATDLGISLGSSSNRFNADLGAVTTTVLTVTGGATTSFEGAVSTTRVNTNVISSSNAGPLLVTAASGTRFVNAIENVLSANSRIPKVFTLTPSSFALDVWRSQGSYAYVHNNSYQTLHVLDLTDPARPVEVLNQGWPQDMTDIAVSGDYLYALSGRVNVFDIKHPGSATLIHQTASGLGGDAIRVSGRYLYVANRSAGKIRIFDLKNPVIPELVGSYDLAQANRLEVYGNWVFAGSDATTSINVINVKNPANPVLYAATQTNDGINAGAFSVENGRLYVSSQGIQAGVWVYDLSKLPFRQIAKLDANSYNTAKQPFYTNDKYLFFSNALGQVEIWDIGTTDAPARIRVLSGIGGNSVMTVGRYLYASENNNIHVMDLGGIETSALLAHSASLGDLKVEGSAYIGNALVVRSGAWFGPQGVNSVGGLSGSFANLSATGTTSTVAGSVEVLDMVSTTQLTVNSQFVCLANGTNCPTGGASDWVYTATGNFLRTSTGTTNVLIGGTSTTDTGLNSQFVINGNDLFVSGNIGSVSSVYTNGAFVAGSGSTYFSDGLISKYTQGELVISTASGTRLVNSLNNVITTSTAMYFRGQKYTDGITYGVSVFGRYAYLANNDTDTVSILDVQNPDAPKVLASVPVAAAPKYLFAAGRYVYVGSTDQMSIVDVKNPESATTVGSVPLGIYANAESIYASGRYVYMLNNNGADDALHIFDVSNPTAPTTTGRLTGLTNPFGLAVDGPRAFVTEITTHLLKVVDVSDKSAPVVTGSVDLGVGTQPNTVVAKGPYAYVALFGTQQLAVVNVASSTPSVVATLSLPVSPQNGQSITLNGRYIYISGGNNIVTIDVADPYNPVVVNNFVVSSITVRGLTIQGRYAYVSIAAANPGGLQVVDLSGIEASSLLAHSAEIGSLSVMEDAQLGGSLYVGNGVMVGNSGINSEGGISIFSEFATSTIAGFVSASSVNVTGALTTGDILPHTDLVYTVGNASLRYHGVFGNVTTTNVTSTNAFFTNLGFVDATGTNVSTTNLAITGSGTSTVNGSLLVSGNVSSTRGNFAGLFVNGASVCLSSGTNCPPSSSAVDWVYAATGAFLRQSTSTTDIVFGNTVTSTGAAAYFDLSGGTNGTSTVYFGFATNTNLVLGGTSTSQTGLNSAFVFDGNDLFVAGNVGSVSSVYTNGDFVAGTGSTRFGNGYIAKNDGNFTFAVSGGSILPSSDQGIGLGSSSQRFNAFFGGVTSTNGVFTDVRSTSVSSTNASTTRLAAEYLENYVVSSSLFTRLSLITSTSSFEYFTLQGRYLYTTAYSNNTIRVFDLADVKKPRLVRQITPSGAGGPLNPYISGRYLYATYFNDGRLAILDTQDRTGLREVSTLTVGTNADEVVVQGRLAYVSYTGGLAIVDVSNPAAPVKIKDISLDAGVRTWGVRVQAGYAYVVTNSGNFRVIDVRDPRNAVVVATVSGLGVTRRLDVQGSYVYMVNAAAGTMRVYDISIPTNPTLVSTATGLTDPYTVYVHGRYAYVSNFNSGAGTTLTVFDVSSSTNIGVAKTLTGFSAAVATGRQFGDLLFVGTTAGDMNILKVPGISVGGITADTGEFSGLQVRNDTNVGGSVSIMGGLNVGNGIFSDASIGINATNTTSTFAGNLFVGGALTATNTQNIFGWKDATGTNLYATNLGTANLSLSNSLVVATGSVSMAYGTTSAVLTGSSGAGTQQFTLQAPSGTRVLANLDNPVTAASTLYKRAQGSINTGNVNDTVGRIALDGRYAYLPVQRTGIADLFQIVDISNLNSPTTTGSVATGTLLSAVYVSGKYAYVSDTQNTLCTMFIFDVSKPSNPFQVGCLPYNAAVIRNANDVFVQGNVAYITHARNGAGQGGILSAVDVTNPANPTVLSSVDLGFTGTTYGVYVQGSYAYVANQQLSLLKIVDIANPSAIAEVGSVSVVGLPYDVKVQGIYAYVNSGSGSNVSIVNVQNPLAPYVVSTVTVAGGLLGNMQVNGKYLYMSNGPVYTVDISNPAAPVLVNTSAAMVGCTRLSVSGRNGFCAGSSGGPTFYSFDMTGADLGAATIANAEIGELQVLNNVRIGNQLNLGGALQVGPLGIITQGGITIGSTSTRGNITTNGSYIAGGTTYASGTVTVVGGNSLTYAIGGGFILPSSDLGVSIGSASARFNGYFGNVTTTNVTTTNLYASGTVSTTQLLVNGRSVCLSNGTNCPTTSGDWTYTNAGAYLRQASSTTDIVFGNTVTSTGAAAYFDLSGSANGTSTFYFGFATNTNVVLGGTSTSQTGLNSLFTMNGNDLFVSGNIGTASSVYTNGAFVAGGATSTQYTSAGISTDNYTYNFLTKGTDPDLGLTGTPSYSFITNDSVQRDMAKFLFSPGGYSVRVGYDGSVFADGYVTSSLGFKVGNVNVCLQNGTNCPAASSGTSTVDFNWRYNTAGDFIYTATGTSNLLIGGTSTTDTGLNAAFTIDGNDLFVSGNIGSVSSVYTNGAFVAGPGSTYYGDGYITKTNGNLALSASGGYVNPSSDLGLSLGTTSTRFDGGAFRYVTSTNVDVNGKITQKITSATEVRQLGSVAIGAGTWNTVFVAGKYAVVARYGADELKVYDVESPEYPKLVMTSSTNGPWSPYVAGNYLYLSNYDDASVSIIDLTSPTSTRTVSTLTGMTEPERVIVIGPNLYVPYNSGLRIYDVSTPSSPTQIGSLSVGANRNYGFYVQRGIAYLSNFDGNVYVVDVRNPASPTLLATKSIGGNLGGLAVRDRYAYVGGFGGSTMYVLDVADPTNPITVTTLGGLNYISHMTLQGDYLYATVDAVGGVAVVDVSSSTAPFIAREFTFEPGSSNMDLAVRGTTLYTVGDNSGILYAWDMGGGAFSAIQSGGAEIGMLSVLNDARIENNLVVGGGLNVGPGGIFSQGGIVAASGTASFGQLNVGGIQVCLQNGTNCPTSSGTDWNYTATGDFLSTVSSSANIVIGGTSTTDFGLNAAFVMNGNDLFVNGNIGSVSSVFTNGEFVVGTGSTHYGDGYIRQSSGNITISAAGGSILPNSDLGLSLGSELLRFNGVFGNVSSSNVTSSRLYVPESTYATIGGISTFPTQSSKTTLGSYSTVALFGRYAIVAGYADNKIQILDVNDPTAPTLLAATTTSGGPWNPVFDGRYLYVHFYDAGEVRIFDVQHPSETSLLAPIGKIGGFTSADGLFLSGSTLYVTDSSGKLFTLDVSNPRLPYVLATVTLPDASGRSRGLVVQGGTAYITNEGAASYYVVDVSNPASPRVRAKRSTALDDLQELAVIGNYGYAYSYIAEMLATFDFTSSTNPQQVATTSFSGLTVKRMVASGQYLYGVEADKVAVFDVTSSTNPTLVARFGSEDLTGAHDLKVQGRYVYVQDQTASKLFIKQIPGVEASGLMAHDAELGKLVVLEDGTIGNRLFVGDAIMVGMGGILSEGPVSVSSVDTTSTFSGNVVVNGKLGMAFTSSTPVSQVYVTSSYIAQLYGVGARGNTAIVLDMGAGTNNIHVYDITDVNRMKNPKTIHLTNNWPYEVAFGGRYAYVTAQGPGSQRFVVIDTQATSGPAVVGSSNQLTQNAVGLAAAGKHVYVLDSAANSLTTFDVSSSSRPKVVSKVTGLTSAQEIAVQGRYAYVTENSGGGGLAILDLEDPASPRLVNTFTGASFNQPYGVAVQGNYAYVTNFAADNVVVVDISNPMDPFEARVLTSPSINGPEGIAIQGRYGYVANGFSGKLVMFDATNPPEAFLLPDLGLAGMKVAIDGNLVLATHYGSPNTFRVYDVGGADLSSVKSDNLKTYALEVMGDANIENRVNAGGGLTVGQGGAQIDGGLLVTGYSASSVASFVNSATSSNYNWGAYINKLLVGNAYATGSDDFSMVLMHSPLTDGLCVTQDIHNCPNRTGTPVSIVADNSIAANAFDVAERYALNGFAEEGDLLILDQENGRTVKQSNGTPYDARMIGVYSTDPGFLLGFGNSGAPVALTGRVPLKVSTVNGVIGVGDALTSSPVAGYAMKATHPGMVVGYALESVTSATSTISVFVNVGFDAKMALGTDASGTITQVTDELVFSATSTATSTNAFVDSWGLTFRGSAWNGMDAVSQDFRLFTDILSATTSKFTISNTSSSNIFTINQAGAAELTGDLRIGGKIYPSARGTLQSDKYIFLDDSLGPTSTYMSTNADGWQSETSYDFAERFYSPDDLSPGDVVTISPVGQSHVQRSTDERAMPAGIVSTRPAFVAGANASSTYPIALSGRVPTNVSTIKGVIKAGDPLGPTSIPGVAAKVSAGPVVGYALEDYAGADVGKIQVYVNPGWYGGGSADTTGSGSAAGFTGGQSGFAVVYTGQTSVQVSFASLGAFPMVQVTPYGEVSGTWWIRGVTDTGFEIVFRDVLVHDVMFAWQAAPSRAGQKMSFSDGTEGTFDPSTGVPFGSRDTTSDEVPSSAGSTSTEFGSTSSTGGSTSSTGAGTP